MKLRLQNYRKLGRIISVIILSVVMTVSISTSIALVSAANLYIIDDFDITSRVSPLAVFIYLLGLFPIDILIAVIHYQQFSKLFDIIDRKLWISSQS